VLVRLFLAMKFSWSIWSLLPLVRVAAISESDCGDPHAVINASNIWIQDDDGFDQARLAQYASMRGTIEEAGRKLNPAVLVQCSHEMHVQSAVRFAERCGFKVAVRSGGHSYTGSSSCNHDRCLQLDLSQMTKINVSGRMITTEPGMRLGDFAQHTLKHFLSVPHGGCSGVGFGGHFQSSAWGFMSQSHGSGLDRVTSFRMVLANGEVGEFSRDGKNSTVFRSVLGSAPGSWGIITQYTLEGVRDVDEPMTHVLMTRIPFSRANFLASWHQVQFIAMDQESRNLRDMRPILIVSPPSEAADTEVWITVVMLWTGTDSGRFTRYWHDQYWQPLLDLEHLPFPSTMDVSMTLSESTRMLANLWTNHDDRYAVQAFHSNYWWDDEFIELIATELEERAAMIPEVYPSFQFLPLGANSQWARNEGMNSLTWRDACAYVDDWMFTKNESRYAEMEDRMRSFRDRTRQFWEYKEYPHDRSTFMSPATTYPNSTDLRNATTARSFFHDEAQFRRLQDVKAALDPTDIFSNMGTIPLPQQILDNQCDPHAHVVASDVWVSGDSGFNQKRMEQYASMRGTEDYARGKLNPGVLVYCSDETHVQSAVQFAARCGYKVAVRSGGHSYTGSSSCSSDACMQLDLTRMTSISTNGRMITTEPGMRLGEFAQHTLKHFLSVPHGGCSGVGFGGHFQSSAWGFMSQSHGSGLDHVASFRMVLANGSVGAFSRDGDGKNSNVFRSVLGSAPGSWGIITQYTLEGVRDIDEPMTHVLMTRIPFSRANFLASWHQVQFIAMDQESRNLRDMRPILIVSPPSEAADTEVWITVVMLWTGTDSGRFTRYWHDQYWQPLLDLEHLPFPSTMDVSMTLSESTRMLANLWTNHDDRYAVQAFHSNYWWDDEFIELIATEMEERAAMIPEVYPSFQFLPLGANSQWARNEGMNSLTWRDACAYVDDWMFTKNESRYAEMEDRMRNFRDRTRRFWEYKEYPHDRSTFMSPATTYPNSTDLRNATTARSFFHDEDHFKSLQLLKEELDPRDVFSNMGTIPLPEVEPNFQVL